MLTNYNTTKALTTFVVGHPTTDLGLANYATTSITNLGVSTPAVAGSVTLSSDAVDSIAINTAGAGYFNAPPITISGDGADATATTTLTAGAVSAINVTAGGSGYSSATAAISAYNGGGANLHINHPTLQGGILRDGQLGIFAASPFGSVALDETVDTTPTVAEAPAIYVAQGNANTANYAATPTPPLALRPYEKTGAVQSRNDIRITKQDASTDTHSTWVIGQDAGNAGEIPATPLDETLYTLNIAYRGHMMDEFYSPTNSAFFEPEFTTPDYTTLSTAEPRDHLIQNLAWEVNRNSKATSVNRTKYKGNEPVIAFAIDSTSTTGTDIDTLTAGDFVPVVNTNFGIRGITMTQGMIDSLQAALTAASVSSDASILTVDISTAGTVTGGVADALILMALDRTPVYDDKIPHTKVRLEVGLKAGFDFNVVYHEEGSGAYEGEGKSRQMDLWYRATHGQRKYNLDHHGDPVIEYPSPFDPTSTVNWNIWTIEHNNNQSTGVGGFDTVPQIQIIALPDTATTTETQLDTVLGAWATSATGSGILTV